MIFRAENLDVAWRMYAAMFSFGDWRLSELNAAQLTSLQVSTLVLAYLTLAWFGIRQFHAQPLTGAPKARAENDGVKEKVDANGPATAQPRSPGAAQDDPAAIAYSPSGALAYRQSWLAQWPLLATRLVLLLLFALSVLKLSAQSFSPFLYFQF